MLTDAADPERLEPEIDGAMDAPDEDCEKLPGWDTLSDPGTELSCDRELTCAALETEGSALSDPATELNCDSEFVSAELTWAILDSAT
jgi:hypothetical protein